MATPHLVGPTVGSTPSTAPPRIWARARRRLPPDLLREASRRLGVMSLVAAILWVVADLAGHLAYRALRPGDPRWVQFQAPDAIGLVAALVSIALFVYTRRRTENPQFILDLGLVYMVFLALTVGVSMHWNPPPEDLMIFPMISWAGAMILMFAAIVPSTPLKTLVASLLAVSMMPVGMLVARARGVWPHADLAQVVVVHYPDYLLVGVAVVISHVMTKLGHHVLRAREMGSYQLGELLARGGMGEIYKASHRMLARPAAIKLIRADAIAPGDEEGARLAVRRFRREAEAAARLTSPHTVALYDFGVTDDQTLYLVMELLHGKTLQALVTDHGPLPPGRAVHVLRQVCDSLEEAHAAGLVHRDIKPANIHVGRVGNRHDYVKVLDFGLVKSVAGGGLEESLSTSTALTPGTPAYMPPEAALGAPIDHRSDLYSLGCVAYFMLTGQLVFEADTALHMVARHLRADPVPPSQRAPFPVPPALDRLVLACLEKKPDDRPQTAGELARSLASVPVEPWTEAQAEAWWTANVRAAPPEVSRRSAG
jgi:serine/threonine-protein kinase